MYLLDTNIVLEIFLNRAEAEPCLGLFASFSMKAPGGMSGFSLHAVEALLGSPQRAELLDKFFKAVLAHNHFHIYPTTLAEETDIPRFMRDTGLDFDDAMQYYVAIKHGFTLVTLDRDFQKVKGVTVLTPRSALERFG